MAAFEMTIDDQSNDVSKPSNQWETNSFHRPASDQEAAGSQSLSQEQLSAIMECYWQVTSLKIVCRPIDMQA